MGSSSAQSRGMKDYFTFSNFFFPFSNFSFIGSLKSQLYHYELQFKYQPIITGFFFSFLAFQLRGRTSAITRLQLLKDVTSQFCINGKIMIHITEQSISYCTLDLCISKCITSILVSIGYPSIDLDKYILSWTFLSISMNISGRGQRIMSNNHNNLSFVKKRLVNTLYHFDTII